MHEVLGRLLWVPLALGWPASAMSQTWRMEDSVLIFRGTAVQGLALTNQSHLDQCTANLRQLYIAGNLWANDNNGTWPGTWQDLVHFLGGPERLYCPADAVHPPQTEWAAVDFSALSYDLVSPGVKPEEFNAVYARCRVHTNLVLLNGLIQIAHPYDARGFPAAAAGALAFPMPSRAASAESRASALCLEHLRQIGRASTLFALDNQDVLPSAWQEITNALFGPANLFCPAESLKAVPEEFAQLDFATVSYVLEATGTPDWLLREQARCPVHGHSLNTDGSVVAGTNRYPPRLIVGHPLSRTVEPGRTGTLSVRTGTAELGPFQFQWRHQAPFDTTGAASTSTLIIPGATNDTLTIPDAQTSDEGYYDVIVYDAQGQYQVSALALVRVEPIANALSDPTWEAQACRSNLREIYLASRAPGRSTNTPASFSALETYAGWPVVLFCPSDPQRVAPDSWRAVEFENTSYVLSRDQPFAATNNVLATCKIHGFQVRNDGTVLAPGTQPLAPRLAVSLDSRAASLVVTIAGLPGTECLLESSSDLAEWTPAATNVLTGGSWSVSNSLPARQARLFYRVSVR